MATYRLFPSTSGPASAITNAGNFISGVAFAINGGGNWFNGYFWWVAASNQSTAPVKCALWSVTSSGTGVVVPGSVVTSGTLTAGQWNFIPLPNPVQLATSLDTNLSTNGSAYIAAIGCNGNFPDTGSFWGSGGPGVNGIWGNGSVGSPLFAYSGIYSGDTVEAPYSIPQGCFSTAGADPSTTMPNGISGTDNFWVDVQISNTAPTGYTGSYRLWPNKFDANHTTGADSAVAYNIATEVDLSVACTPNVIHYYVSPGALTAAGLATSADVWNISTQQKVASIPSPAWTTESGGSVTTGGQWVKAAFPGGTPNLPIGKYRVSVFNANGAAGSWSSKDASSGYFTVGVAKNGIISGPMTAPNQTNAQLATFYPGTGTGTTGGQPVFEYHGSDTFPSFTTGTNPPQVYWVDLELTPMIGPVLTPATTQTTIAVNAYVQYSTSFTISSAAGAPFQGNMRQLAMDRWNYMYPS